MRFRHALHLILVLGSLELACTDQGPLDFAVPLQHFVGPLAHSHTKRPSHPDQQILQPSSCVRDGRPAQAVLEVLEQVLGSIAFAKFLVVKIGRDCPRSTSELASELRTKKLPLVLGGLLPTKADLTSIVIPAGWLSIPTGHFLEVFGHLLRVNSPRWSSKR